MSCSIMNCSISKLTNFINTNTSIQFDLNYGSPRTNHFDSIFISSTCPFYDNLIHNWNMNPNFDEHIPIDKTKQPPCTNSLDSHKQQEILGFLTHNITTFLQPQILLFPHKDRQKTIITQLIQEVNKNDTMFWMLIDRSST